MYVRPPVLRHKRCATTNSVLFLVKVGSVFSSAAITVPVHKQEGIHIQPTVHTDVWKCRLLIVNTCKTRDSMLCFMHAEPIAQTRGHPSNFVATHDEKRTSPHRERISEQTNGADCWCAWEWRC